MSDQSSAFLTGILCGFFVAEFWGWKLLTWMIEKDWTIYEKRKPKQ